MRAVPSPRKIARVLPALVLLVLSLLAGVAVSIQPVSAQSAASLAAEYAPVLHFAAGEPFYPTSVDYILSSSTLVTRNANGTLTTIDPNPTTSTLGNYTDPSYFLDNRYGNESGVAAAYAAAQQSLGYYSYVHIASYTNGTVIQYWLFYAYNEGQLDDHQTDLEVVEVFLDASGTPTMALYSQHVSGETASWANVEKWNGHPVVYVALGSHANFFRPYQGHIGIENDVVNDGGPTIYPSQLNLVILESGPNRPANQSWLAFPGRWGYVGTQVQVATGNAGPYGPVFNDGGIRWAAPYSYEAKTLPVNGEYFDLAWVAANFLLIFVAYIGVRAAVKLYRIIRLSRREGLKVRKFLMGRGGIAVAIGLGGVAITVAALFLPWYAISASSQSGPLSGTGPVTLMSVNGVHGLQLNLFTGPNVDTSSGLETFASADLPFGIIIGAGLILLLFDIIGVRKGKSLGWKFIWGAVTSLLPFIVIYAFIAFGLPRLVPLGSDLVGAPIPSQVTSLVGSISSSPASGTASAALPVVGNTTVTWGFGLGAYLFLVAAAVRIAAGMLCRTAPDLGAPSVPSPAMNAPTPSPATPVPSRPGS